MAARRRSTLGTAHDTAPEVPKSVELEQRLSRLERGLRDLSEKIAVLTKRTVALQAHIDHLDARGGGR